MDVYPLIFTPIFKPKIWGGRSLETLLNKPLPPGQKIGESWEVADLEEDQSVVARGPAKGKTLGELVREWGSGLLGEAPLFENRFPLLIKYLDANETLSVQVHPDKATAQRLGGCVRVKNEAWYVLAAEEGSAIYRGVCDGVSAEDLRQAIREGRTESALRRIPVHKGQCYYLPSGTIHALGAGVTVAEVQTPSDITYRVYDWDRIDASTGKPRELHLEEALGCISFDAGPIEGERPEHVAGVWTTITRLVHCESFIIERVRMSEGVEQEIPVRSFVIWMVLEGRGSIIREGSEAIDFVAGDSVLLPAALKNSRVRISESCMWLEVSIPIPSDLAGYDRIDREALRDTNDGGGLVSVRVPDDGAPT